MMKLRRMHLIGIAAVVITISIVVVFGRGSKNEVVKEDMAQSKELKDIYTWRAETDEEKKWVNLVTSAMKTFDEEDFEGAEEISKEALELSEKLFGNEHINHVISLQALAQIFAATDNPNRTKLYLTRAVSYCTDEVATQGLACVDSLLDLGVMLRAEGKFDEAKGHLRRAEEILTKLGQLKGTRIANVYRHLGGIALQQKEFTIAENYVNKILKIKIDLLGQDHPHVALSLIDLANLQYQQGHSKKAKGIFQQALNIFEKLGSDYEEQITNLKQVIESIQ